jgi:hypothetical protein
MAGRHRWNPQPGPPPKKHHLATPVTKREWTQVALQIKLLLSVIVQVAKLVHTLLGLHGS